jgi:hypothetical protein
MHGGVHTVVFSGCIRVCDYSWGVHTVVFSGCIRVCDYSWGESIQLCLVVVYECVTTRGGSPYSCV